MKPLELKRLGQFLSGEIALDTDPEVVPRNYTDTPIPDDPGISWCLVGAQRGPRHVVGWHHRECGRLTGTAGSESRTLATDPEFYETLYCHGCRERFPIAAFRLVHG